MDTQPAAPRGPPRHTGYCDWLRECDLHDPGGWLTEWDLGESGASEAGGGYFSFFFFFLIVCFTSYFVFSIAVLPHSPGVVYYHLLLRRETRIPGVAPFSF